VERTAPIGQIARTKWMPGREAWIQAAGDLPLSTACLGWFGSLLVQAPTPSRRTYIHHQQVAECGL